MQHSIVCGIDRSPSSRSAARVAARLARRLGLRCVLAHVTEDRPTFPYRDRRLGELQRRRAIEDGQRLLTAVVAELPDIVPETRVVLGTPVEGLSSVGREEAAELLIVGSRGRGSLTAALLGSVSGHLASSAECPVLVVPGPEAADRFLAREPVAGCIVCGVDASAESERASEIATDLAERMASSGRGERGALRAAALGSLSRVLAAAAPVPVLVVPPTARPTGSAHRSAGRSVGGADGRERPVTRDRSQEVLVKQPTQRQAAVQRRFSEGIEQLPDTPSKLHTGVFSAGNEQLPRTRSTLRSARFSAGTEHLPETPSKQRRGSFASGHDKV